MLGVFGTTIISCIWLLRLNSHHGQREVIQNVALDGRAPLAMTRENTILCFLSSVFCPLFTCHHEQREVIQNIALDGHAPLAMTL